MLHLIERHGPALLHGQRGVVHFIASSATPVEDQCSASADFEAGSADHARAAVDRTIEDDCAFADAERRGSGVPADVVELFQGLRLAYAGRDSQRAVGADVDHARECSARRID